jgi:nucleoside-diphosphate-sugar epimerase
MRLLITGGAGFLGARLAREILARRHLAGQLVREVVISDLVAPPPDLLDDSRIVPAVAPMLEQADLFASGFDGVFHMASAVSGECEMNFDLGMHSNLDSTRLLLDGIRRSGKAARLVFSSSVAVFGPYGTEPMPDMVSDTTLPSPQTSYGTQKLMLEYLIADYSRKGFIDGRSARLMTVTVRPGSPNGAASSFFSGIIREPLAGVDSMCPVDAGVSHPVASPSTTIAGLLTLFEISESSLGNRLALNLPGLTVTVAQMLDALERVAGTVVRQRVHFEKDPRIAAIVDKWPRGASSGRSHALGLVADASFDAIIEQYIDDCRNRIGYPPKALQGL